MNTKTRSARVALVAGVVLLGALTSGPALAQSKIAVIEVERLLQESGRGQVAVHQSHQLSPFKSITPPQVAFTHDFAEILSKVVPLMTS